VSKDKKRKVEVKKTSVSPIRRQVTLEFQDITYRLREGDFFNLQIEAGSCVAGEPPTLHNFAIRVLAID